MKKTGKGKKLMLLLAALVLALAAVLAVIVYKQLEYNASGEYYESLRSVGLLRAEAMV